jgi:hypothetical protein
MPITVESRAIHVRDGLNDIHLTAIKTEGSPDDLSLKEEISQIFNVRPSLVFYFSDVTEMLKEARLFNEPLRELSEEQRYMFFVRSMIIGQLTGKAARISVSPFDLYDFLFIKSWEPRPKDIDEAFYQLLEYQISVAQSPTLGNVTLKEIFSKGVHSACYFPLSAGLFYGSQYLATGDIGMAIKVYGAGGFGSLIAFTTTVVGDKMLQWGKIRESTRSRKAAPKQPPFAPTKRPARSIDLSDEGGEKKGP